MAEQIEKSPLDDIFACWEEYCAEQVDFVNRELRKKRGDNNARDSGKT